MNHSVIRKAMYRKRKGIAKEMERECNGTAKEIEICSALATFSKGFELTNTFQSDR